MGFYDLAEVEWDHPELDGKWSPAEVNQILFRNFEDPVQAMRELVELTPGMALTNLVDTDQTAVQLPLLSTL